MVVVVKCLGVCGCVLLCCVGVVVWFSGHVYVVVVVSVAVAAAAAAVLVVTVVVLGGGGGGVGGWPIIMR